jgi:hypothetical protein
MRRGQSAFEYILVVGIAMLLIVPGAILFYNYSKRSGDELLRSQVDMAGSDIMDAVEKVYYIGENTWETIKVYFPDNVRWIYIMNDSELVIEYDSNAGISQAIFFSDNINITNPDGPGYRLLGKQYITNITGEPNQAGLRIIKISSMATTTGVHYVLINETR